MQELEGPSSNQASRARLITTCRLDGLGTQLDGFRTLDPVTSCNPPDPFPQVGSPPGSPRRSSRNQSQPDSSPPRRPTRSTSQVQMYQIFPFTIFSLIPCLCPRPAGGVATGESAQEYSESEPAGLIPALSSHEINLPGTHQFFPFCLSCQLCLPDDVFGPGWHCQDCCRLYSPPQVGPGRRRYTLCFCLLPVHETGKVHGNGKSS